MSRTTECKAAAPAHSPLKGKLAHWGRVTVMCLSGGFVFPHALTENEDAQKAAPTVERTTKGS